MKCLVPQSAPFCCLPFYSTQFLSSSTHPQILTHFRTTHCCPQNGAQFQYGGSFSVVYSKMINGAANYFFSKKCHQQFISGQFRSVLAPLSTVRITFQSSWRTELFCTEMLTAIWIASAAACSISSLNVENLRIQFIIHWNIAQID